MPSNNVLINGKTYGWVNTTINVLGRDVTGIMAMSYSEEKEMEDIYGAGNRPIARGEGKIKAEASMTLLSEEVIALQQASGGDILSIEPFDLIVKYRQGTKMVTDIVKNCQFLSNKRDLKEGDKSISVELKLITSHIIWSKP
jgi:hypothetical protein